MDDYKIIKGGSNTYIIGGNTEYSMDRFDLWMEKNPDVAINNILGDKTIKDLRDMPNPFNYLVFKLGIYGPINHIFRNLHNAIVNVYLKCIDETAIEEKEKINFHEDVKEYPKNYTESMQRLKNITFDGWDASNIGGFCPIEPFVRLAQLVKYPINTFGDFDFNISKITIPKYDFNKYDIEIGKINNPEQFKMYLQKIKPALLEYEQYTKELAEVLIEITKEIEQLV